MCVCVFIYIFAFVRCMRIYKFTGALQPSAECHVHFQSMRSSTRFSTQLRCSTKSASSYAIPENCIWFVPTSRCVDILCMYVHVYQRTSVYKIVTLWVSIKRVALCMPPGATWVMQTRKGHSATCAVKLMKIIRCPKRLTATCCCAQPPAFWNFCGQLVW